MKALVYRGPYEMQVENVPDARIEHPNDVVLRLTTSCICGSDLHMYEGRAGADDGIVFGHENMGIVEEVGDGVVSVARGDRVVVPFNVSCGFCKNCVAGYSAFCLTVNEGMAGGAYGYVNMGPYRGGQAEYLRVPFADYNCLQLPKGEDHEDASCCSPTSSRPATTARLWPRFSRESRWPSTARGRSVCWLRTRR
ncbi:MAG TPA: alcohol dehydrogenase catalytic domain-containing protein [Solirubrobacteraceae bacterium]|jgi:glutathione-independent formaldehyde dehydrogenase|nr:alcohol dehydrogenase catalytic domain-containing protein [Solirubrobacteraceae bacterium]